MRSGPGSREAVARWAARAVALGLALGLAGFAGDARADKVTRGQLRTLYYPKGQARGTVVLFHGFSTGPGQWSTYARWLHEAKGFDVISAPLPGHGPPGLTSLPDLSRLPRAAESETYARHGEMVFRLARRRGNPIHLVGFSAGGAEALFTALRHGDERRNGAPLIASVSAVNPFLEATPKTWGGRLLRLGPAQTAFDHVDRLTLGLASRVVDRLPFDMADGVRWPRTEVMQRAFRRIRLGHLIALHRFGQRVLKSSHELESTRVRLFLSNDPVASAEASTRAGIRLGAEMTYLPVKTHNPVEGPAHTRILGEITDTIEGPPVP